MATPADWPLQKVEVSEPSVADLCPAGSAPGNVLRNASLLASAGGCWWAGSTLGGTATAWHAGSGLAEPMAALLPETEGGDAPIQAPTRLVVAHGPWLAVAAGSTLHVQHTPLPTPPIGGVAAAMSARVACPDAWLDAAWADVCEGLLAAVTQVGCTSACSGPGSLCCVDPPTARGNLQRRRLPRVVPLLSRQA
jgi:hypothetical protein